MSGAERQGARQAVEAEAAEYVLGLLPEAEARALEDRLTGDADLRQDVAAWSAYFASYTETLPEVPPPPQVQRRLEARVFGAGKRRPVWKQLRPYLVGAVAGAALAWGALTLGVMAPDRTDLQAELRAASGDRGLTVRFEAARGVMEVTSQAGAPPDGRVLALWLMSGDTPVLLARWQGETLRLALPAGLAGDLVGARLVVTEEAADAVTRDAPGDNPRAEGRLVPVGPG